MVRFRCFGSGPLLTSPAFLFWWWLMKDVQRIAIVDPSDATREPLRNLLLGVESVHGNDLTAVYAIGPSIDDAFPAVWSRRQGHIVDDSFVFDEKGKSTLRFRPRPDGGLSASWSSADGKTSMAAHLRSIDPQSVARRGSAKGSAPVPAAAAHGDGDQAEN